MLSKLRRYIALAMLQSKLKYSPIIFSSPWTQWLRFKQKLWDAHRQNGLRMNCAMKLLWKKYWNRKQNKVVFGQSYFDFRTKKWIIWLSVQKIKYYHEEVEQYRSNLNETWNVRTKIVSYKKNKSPLSYDNKRVTAEKINNFFGGVEKSIWRSDKGCRSGISRWHSRGRVNAKS